MLVSASKKVSLKNRILSNLFSIENPIMTIPYVFKAELSIFCALITISQVARPNLATNSGVIALISVPELIKALTSVA